MLAGLSKHIEKPVSIAPLIIFRVLFGFLILGSIIRFWLKGWIYDLYIAPGFHFSYYGFEWVKPLGENGMYAIFIIMILATVGIILGFCYRTSAILFFLAFTYVELIDKSNYLNHYYFVSLISFIMIWLPANRYFSLDVFRNTSLLINKVPAWTINILKLQLGIVYFYAGLAKLNHDWLIEAMPLKMWLPVNNHIPIIGGFMDELWVAYFFSWFGAAYDLTIVFFLLIRKTRLYGFIAVIAFHLATWLLFPIGMFPFIMIFSTLIFFSSDFHEKLIDKIKRLLNITSQPDTWSPKKPVMPFIKYIFLLFIIFQLLFPWRYLLYPGNLFWTEEGYRFSWRVMLIEKAGYVTFHIYDPATNSKGEVSPNQYLTPNQEKQMATQPDMILQFVHFLEKEYQAKGIKEPQIRAEAYVTLNGQGSRLFIDKERDLTKEEDSFLHKNWILRYN